MSESTKPTEKEATKADASAAGEAVGASEAEVAEAPLAEPTALADAAHQVPAEGTSAGASTLAGMPDGLLLPRLLARGEQLARQLPSIPEELWDEGGTAHLSKPGQDVDLDDPFAWSMDVLEAHDAASFGVSEGALAGSSSPGEDAETPSWTWWLRPLWGLGVVALIAAVWLRSPNESISPISGTSSPTRRAAAPVDARRPVPPRRMRYRLKMPYPRLFPAHRLRPKGLPLPGQRPGLAPTTRPTSKPAARAGAVAPVTFQWFMRRGRTTREGHSGMVLQADDELRFAYRGVAASVQGAYFFVVMLDAKGQLSPIYPAGKGVTLRLQGQGSPRRLFWLPDGAVLDDALVAERIFVCASRMPHPIARVQRVAKQALQATPLRRLKTLPLRCLYQRSWLIYKQPKGQ